TRASSIVADEQYRDQERQGMFTVKQAFTNMLLAKANPDVPNQNLGAYRHTVDPSRDRLNAGDISATDFARIDLQLAQFESDASNATMSLQQAAIQLQTLLGIAHPSLIFDVVGPLDPPDLTINALDLEQ